MKQIEVVITFLRSIPRRVIELVFLVCVVAFFALYLHGLNWDQLAHLHYSWWYLVAATVFATAFRFWAVMIWRYILTDLGASKLPGFRLMADVYAKAWMGRYIPGTVTWIAGKVYMASAYGISKSRLAVSSLLEGGMQIIALMVVAMLLLGFDPRLTVIPLKYKIVMIILAGCLLLVLTPAIFNRILRLAYFAVKKKEPHDELFINRRAVIRSFILYAFGGFIAGLSEFFIVRTIVPGLPWHDFWFVVGSFNLAGALGMLAIGVPSGIGVRDGAILLLLSAILPKELALAITVTSRIWGAFADVVFFAIAAGLHRLTKPQKAA